MELLLGVKGGVREFKRFYDQDNKNRKEFGVLDETLSSLDPMLDKVQDLVTNGAMEDSKALRTLKGIVDESVQCIRGYKGRSRLSRVLGADGIRDRIENLSRRLNSQVPILGADITASLAKAKEDARRVANEVRAKLAAQCGPRVDLSKCGINSLVAHEIAPDISKRRDTKELVLNGNPLGEVGAKELAFHIAHLAELELLEMYLCSLGAAGVKILCEHLAPHKRLHRLDLSGNGIGDLGAREIAKLSNLQELSLGVNNIGVHGARELAKISGLQELYLGGNNLGDPGACVVASLDNLRWLHLGSNNIGDRGACEVTRLGDLQWLHLGNNKIGDRGVRDIVRLSKLQTLNLNGNNIAEQGACEIAKLSGLQSLDLGDNDLSEAGKDVLRWALPDCSLSL